MNLTDQHYLKNMLDPVLPQDEKSLYNEQTVIVIKEWIPNLHYIFLQIERSPTFD